MINLKMTMLAAFGMAMRAMPAFEEIDPGPMVAGDAYGMPMRPAPINPDWIMDGAPVARIAEHSRAADEAASTAIWDCTDGTFRWYFGWDETVMILEGEVRVTSQEGETRLLKAGDLAYFKGGTWALWQVRGYVRKIAFVRKPFPKPLALAMRIKNRIKGTVPGGF